jgi:hypothetical protein
MADLGYFIGGPLHGQFRYTYDGRQTIIALAQPIRSLYLMRDDEDPGSLIEIRKVVYRRYTHPKIIESIYLLEGD